MNIEHLSHWSGQLNREMYLNRRDLLDSYTITTS